MIWLILSTRTWLRISVNIVNDYAGKTAQTRTMSCTQGHRVTLCLLTGSATTQSTYTVLMSFHSQAGVSSDLYLYKWHFNEYRLIPQVIDKLDSSPFIHWSSQWAFDSVVHKPGGAQRKEQILGVAGMYRTFLPVAYYLTALQSTGLVRRKGKPSAGVARPWVQLQAPYLIV